MPGVRCEHWEDEDMADVSMGPATVNISGIRAGDRNLFTMTLKENGTGMNLTGATLKAQVKLKAVDPTPALEAEITVLDATAGKISVRWPGADVAALLNSMSTWTGVWDMQITQGGQDPVTICAGSFTAVMDVTR